MLSIWIPTTYTSPTVLSEHLQLLPNSNFTFLTLGAILSKMSNFYMSVDDSILKLNPTHQHESMGMLSF